MVCLFWSESRVLCLHEAIVVQQVSSHSIVEILQVRSDQHINDNTGITAAHSNIRSPILPKGTLESNI